MSYDKMFKIQIKQTRISYFAHIDDTRVLYMIYKNKKL